MRRAPKLLLGGLAFAVDAIPVAAIATFFLGGKTPDWLATAAILAFLIAAGLHIPLYLILTAVASEHAKGEPPASLAVFDHPLFLSEFWWRHIR